jgi:peptide methionine sulfoxide reductase MsrB
LISKFRKFFSQTGEDKLLSKYLPEMKGQYIDIGSGQPVRGSNTYFLSKKGWSGHLIDPLRFNLRLSKIFRKRDIKIEGLVSSQTEVLKFYEF